jgi:hypothetical protein
MIEGQLVAINKKTLQVKFTNTNGKEVTFNIKESELSTSILEKKKKNLSELNEVEVELEVVGGQPKRITEKGQEWVSSQTSDQSQRKVIVSQKKDSSSSVEPKQQEQANKRVIDRIPQRNKSDSNKSNKVLPPPSREPRVLPPPIKNSSILPVVDEPTQEKVESLIVEQPSEAVILEKATLELDKIQHEVEVVDLAQEVI